MALEPKLYVCESQPGCEVNFCLIKHNWKDFQLDHARPQMSFKNLLSFFQTNTSFFAIALVMLTKVRLISNY